VDGEPDDRAASRGAEMAEEGGAGVEAAGTGEVSGVCRGQEGLGQTSAATSGERGKDFVKTGCNAVATLSAFD